MTAPAALDTGATRFAFIHILRGAAALIVVWSHLSGFWLQSNNLSSSIQNAWQQWVVVPFHVFQNGGHLGVVLFFLISGYIITHTLLRENRFSFVTKRTMRIFPPLILAIAITWILFRASLALGTPLIGVHGGGIWHWLSATVLLDGFFTDGFRALEVTWTLVVEIYFYILALVLLNAFKKNALRSIWVMILMWSVLFVSTKNLDLLGSNGELTVYVGFLILGQIIYFAQRGTIRIFDAVVSGSLVALLYPLFMETVHPGFILTPGGWSGIEPIVSYVYALVIFIAMMRLAPARVLQPFRLLGDVSYSLYLLHMPVGFFVMNFLNQLGISNSLNTIIAIIASIAVAWLAYRFVELPSQKFARRILQTRARSRPETLVPTAQVT